VLVSSGSRVEGTLSEAFSVDVLALRVMAQNCKREGQGAGVVLMRVEAIDRQMVLVSAASRVGSTSCASTAWSNDTSVVSLSAAGGGHSWSVSLTAGVRAWSLSQALSFDAGVVSSVRTHNTLVHASSRGFAMSVSVAWMDEVDRSGGGRLGASACESSSWQSKTALTCLVPSGKAERGVQAVVTVAQMVGSISKAFTYLAPMATGGVPSNLMQRLMRLEVLGWNLGGHACSPVVRVGVTSAEASAWVSESSVLALVGRGESSSLRLAVTVLNISATRAVAVSFDVGSIAGMASGALNLAQLSSNWSALTISGAALGMVDMSARQRVGASACEVTVWRSDTRVSARASSGGVASVRVVLSAGGSRVASRTSLLSYDALLLVGAERGSRNLVARFSQVLALHSPPSAFATPRLRLASSSCQASSWLSDTTIACQMPAAGPSSSTFARAFPLVITTGTRVGSLTQVFSYDALRVSSTDGNAAVAAARTISLTGSGFMSGHMSARARIRGTGTLGAHWVSDSRLGCKLALSSASTQASLSVSMGTHAFA
jgi:hypothetical protein